MKKKVLYFIVRNLVIYLAILTLFYLYDQKKIDRRQGWIVFYPYIMITLWYGWILTHNTLLLGQLFLKKKYALYAAIYLPYLFGFGYLEIMIFKKAGFVDSNLQGAILTALGYSFLGACLYLAYRYMVEKKTFYQITSVKREIELNQLKSQLNPHFLFNALNNIYSYTLHNNKYGNELILKLSELMRFILDSSVKDKIRIEDEVRFVEDYIAFEKERLGERCDINYQKTLKFPEREISPLILFPFIENAFKYGSNTIQKTSVEILISDTDNTLQLLVKNSIINKEMPSTKKGLPNATRLLELLYTNRHELIITTQNDIFKVELTLSYANN